MIGISNLNLHKWFLWVAKQSQYPYLHILAIIWSKEALYAMCQHALALAIWWLYSTNVRGHLFCYNSSTLENICWCYKGLDDRHIIPTFLPLSASRYGAVTKTNYPSTELNLKITSRQGWRKVAAVGRGWFHSLSSDTAQRWNPVISEHGKLARINYGCRMTFSVAVSLILES